MNQGQAKVVSEDALAKLGDSKLHQAAAGTEALKAQAMASVQSALVVAIGNPRNVIQKIEAIKEHCKRHEFAMKAFYSYPRGGKTVSGPSIRLAELLAQNWGNLLCGFRNLGRRGDVTDMESYCWDLESNTQFVRQYQVKHWRDKTDGGVALTSERDIYEMEANQAQRRLRACILATIPSYVCDAAVEVCKKTLAEGDGRPIQDRIQFAVECFGEVGVTVAMLEKRIDCPIASITGEILVELQGVYNTLRDGGARREDYFDIYEGAQKPQAATQPPAQAEGTGAAAETDAGDSAQQAAPQAKPEPTQPDINPNILCAQCGQPYGEHDKGVCPGGEGQFKAPAPELTDEERKILERANEKTAEKRKQIEATEAKDEPQPVGKAAAKPKGKGQNTIPF